MECHELIMLCVNILGILFFICPAFFVENKAIPQQFITIIPSFTYLLPEH